MEQLARRQLGRSGLEVSSLSLGTVELGLDYGIGTAVERAKPPRAAAIALLECAVRAGINFFDTAPAYGDSERLLGEAAGLLGGCFIATKVEIPKDSAGRLLRGVALRNAVEASIERSLRRLGRETLDIVHIHNATVEVIQRGEITDLLQRSKGEGLLRFVGASVYGEEAAFAVIETGRFDVLQVAYNLLDQRMAKGVMRAAQQAGVGIVVRSALLKGVLTPRVRAVRRGLGPLRTAAERAVQNLAESWEALPRAAVRFCLSNQDVDTVLVGVRTRRELDEVLEAAHNGMLSPSRQAIAKHLAVSDTRLLNPAGWALR